MTGMVLRIGVPLLALGLLCGCTGAHKVDVEDVGHIELRVDDGPPVLIRRGSRQHNRIVNWLFRHPLGWQKYRAEVPEDALAFYADSFALYVQQYDVVLEQTGEPLLTRHLNATDLMQFAEIVELATESRTADPAARQGL